MSNHLTHERALGLIHWALKDRIVRAKTLAEIAHHGQRDKAGEDYFSGHLTRVVNRVVSPHHLEVWQAAWLHDIVEDTPVTLHHLVAMDFDPIVIAAVDQLTHPRHLGYDVYIDNMVEAKGFHAVVARRVKLADIEDHLDDTTHLTPAQVGKYRIAKSQLAERIDGGAP